MHTHRRHPSASTEWSNPIERGAPVGASATGDRATEQPNRGTRESAGDPRGASLFSDGLLSAGLCSAAICAALLAGCASQRELPTATAHASTLSNELTYQDMTLGPGDLLRVGVHGRPELSTPTVANPSGTRIGTDGNLSLPLAGEVHVAGLTIERAREEITAAYARYLKAPRVDVNVVEYASRRFYLFGEVSKPGAYVIDRPLNLYQALTLGGGFTARARREEVVLLRGTPDNLEVLVFDGETPEARGFAAVKPDDFVFVRRSGAGQFADEVLPYLSGIGSTLSSVATVILIQDKLSN